MPTKSAASPKWRRPFSSEGPAPARDSAAQSQVSLRDADWACAAFTVTHVDETELHSFLCAGPQNHKKKPQRMSKQTFPPQYEETEAQRDECSPPEPSLSRLPKFYLIAFTGFVFCLFVCSLLYFEGRTCGIWRFPGQGPIAALAAGLHHSHSNAGSEPRLRPTPQLTATPDP